MNRVDVLGVQVHGVHKVGILSQVSRWAAETNLRTVSYANAHCLNVSQSDSEYRDLLNAMDLLYCDGVGVVWAGRFLHGAHLYKVTGRDWIDDFSALAAAQGWGVYILAGEPGHAQRAGENLKRRWPTLRFLGAADGFFRERSETQVLREIEARRPQVVFVGLGAPRQEKWLARLRSQIAAPVCWAVGALFDYVAGVEPPVPGWLDALALEWLWRLSMDPLGKWRRYVLGNPLFVARVLRQKLARQVSGR